MFMKQLNFLKIFTQFYFWYELVNFTEVKWLLLNQLFNLSELKFIFMGGRNNFVLLANLIFFLILANGE